MPKAGKSVGEYILKRMIKEGGMGIVWLAEQKQPDREVAIKFLKIGSDPLRNEAIFNTEIDALSRFQHPNIVPVISGGWVEGTPYLVMVYIEDGLPISVFCKHHSVSTREILKLFPSICGAYEHLHQLRILHRDIHPGNILVVRNKDKLKPILIDFGLALRLNDSVGHAPFIQTSLPKGVHRYASPEQAGHNGGLLTSSSDVYSLGAILYELLTGGVGPLDHAFLGVSPKSRWEIVRDATRSPDALSRHVTRELSSIVMKAIALETEDRYPTPEKLAEDLDNFLHKRRVQAHTGATYVTRKWFRKHWVPIALASGLIGTSLGYNEARQQQSIAQASEDSALAVLRSTTDDVIQEFIGRSASLGPQERAFLERTLARWKTFAEQSGEDFRTKGIQAEGHFRIGQLWFRLGKNDEAGSAADGAISLLNSLRSQFPNDKQYAIDLSNCHLLKAQLALDRKLPDQARGECQTVLRMLKPLLSKPMNTTIRAELLAALNTLGIACRETKNLDVGKDAYEQAFRLHPPREKMRGETPEFVSLCAWTYCNYGTLLSEVSVR